MVPCSWGESFMHLSPAAGNALFFGSFLVFAFVLFSFFLHLFASFSYAAEANQAEGKINRQITPVRRRVVIVVAVAVAGV